MIVFFIVAIVGLPIGLGFLIYTVPKKLGYSQVAKYLTYAYGLIVLLFGISLAFEDQLFTKNNAKDLVEEQEILLLDKFDLTENESMYAIGDYYHTFTLKISTKDKENAISKIRNAENFDINKNDSIDTLMYLPEPDRYFGEKLQKIMRQKTLSFVNILSHLDVKDMHPLLDE